VLSSAQIECARKFGTATLHEAGGRIGALPGALRPVDARFSLAGAALTVHVPAGDNLWIHRALYLAKPGDILVVCTGGGHEFGYWGEILNEAAMARQLGGLVIDGGVRDVAALSRMDFPVFSRGVCIRGTGKDHDAIAWVNKPIQIGDVTINADDLIVGDIDGVVALPQARVGEILDRSAAREADEAVKIKKLREGATTLDLYGFGEGAFR
jgi:4-hydroxy-4-methyl-2-oxoglutarate aldolase